MSDSTVPAFVVLATDARGVDQELGMFFKVTDVDKFVEGLRHAWKNPRIEPRELHKDHVHAAHHSLFPDVFPKAK